MRPGIKEGRLALDGDKNSLHGFIGRIAPQILLAFTDNEEDRCYEYIGLAYQIV
jgi:hypothetical protein